jgi:hypothetical protein
MHGEISVRRELQDTNASATGGNMSRPVLGNFFEGTGFTKCERCMAEHFISRAFKKNV